MRLNVVLAASARLAASLIALAAAPAFAGDRAGFNPLGFSADGRYFAFEEFGIQDGSGFPYSNIYALDLPADKWVAGSPFSARLDTEGASLSEARRQAINLADVTLDKLALAAPAELVALNGDGEPGDSQTLSFGRPGYALAEPQNVRTLSIDTFPATPSGTPCAHYTDKPTVGLVLRLDDVEIHRDKSLPTSRGCVLDYGIYGVVAPFGADIGTSGAVVIVSVYPFGFEGPDRRFIAIPIDQP